MLITQRHKAYWKRTLRITGILLALWFVVTFVVSYFAHELSKFSLFGIPFGFYMGSQGALLIYLFIIWIYVKYMNALDREFGVSEGED
ncbi:DUF4212 domain-containing protein [Propionivibrio sp.]|uniref:DUF4212 domain-containing protein n=1 Tax=Propionivibrio sp. TaxID=2212460 RepID=UPI0025D1CC02|nr:DUF4212 domain-containing protein [Propionivibrio sp.]MBK7356739.1 DUF4212 domain-containing protein [Propionivibrio sp.]MBK8401150.1 DUF4212 domain-containing protein [Propionivibrio sp.]MBK8743682.1 DUF4212 domain-containing protein [Propionivibrio sp.]MBK8894921.1 DUF4212 domain-containing protein [Propionivibrio sp.]MBL0208483.1 DUF4212 domain-containing protein [Propionivibrio sp.]